MRIAMIGTGYVGLVSGACFADFGHQVTCVDKDGDKIASLQRGEIPIFEPGLDELVASNVAAGRLSFSLDLASAVAGADAVFIAVGTPPDEDGSADLKYVTAAARSIGKQLSLTVSEVNASLDRTLPKIDNELKMRYVALDLMRLDELISVFAKRAIEQEDVPAGMLVIKSLERRSALLGTDARTTDPDAGFLVIVIKPISSRAGCAGT